MMSPPRRVSARRIPPPPSRRLILDVTAAEFAELEKAAARAGVTPLEWATKMVVNTATLANSVEKLFPKKESKP